MTELITKLGIKGVQVCVRWLGAFGVWQSWQYHAVYPNVPNIDMDWVPSGAETLRSQSSYSTHVCGAVASAGRGAVGFVARGVDAVSARLFPPFSCHTQMRPVLLAFATPLLCS